VTDGPLHLPRPLLPEAGEVCVTDATARSCAGPLRVRTPDEARRLLESLLATARLVDVAGPGGHPPARYRARGGGSPWDVTARVVVEGGRAVVVSATVRGAVNGRTRQRRAQARRGGP
jgi:hypothetical protein